MNCPSCNAVIYSRRSGRCGVCGVELPKDLLFSDEQREKIEEQMARMKADHRAAQVNLDRLNETSRGDIP